MIKKSFSYINLNNNLKKSSHYIKDLQWKRFQYIINYAYNNVPFYQEKFDDEGINPSMIKTRNDVQKIPLTTREELVFAKDKIISREYDKKKLKTSTTSGSTGTPFTSYFDNNAWIILKYASKLRVRKICGMSMNSKIVNIEAERGIELKNKRTFFGPKIYYFSIFDEIEKHISFYNKIKPDVLYGPPSYFAKLREYLLKDNIYHKYPKLIFTSAEMLDVSTKKNLKSFFGDNIYDIYGSTEFKEISWECPICNGYHINDDLYLTEFIENKSSDYDKDIVVTSLINKAMPLIRYITGDRGLKLEKQKYCKIPFDLMSLTGGRSVDYFILKDERSFSPYALTMTLEPIEGILQYQIVQIDYNVIEIRVRTSNKSDDEIETNIKKEFRELLGDNVDIKVVFYLKEIPREKNGKYKVVKSEIKK